ncbi:hypothetical protein EDC04DRAFT_2624755 [Pisolithus marmoratus]|nr:hypothetical protein EDC04DRAFT_2624755 [Pisolithus marmoratus]
MTSSMQDVILEGHLPYTCERRCGIWCLPDHAGSILFDRVSCIPSVSLPKPNSSRVCSSALITVRDHLFENHRAMCFSARTAVYSVPLQDPCLKQRHFCPLSCRLAYNNMTLTTPEKATSARKWQKLTKRRTRATSRLGLYLLPALTDMRV